MQKKAYIVPDLIVYGNVQALTRQGNIDGFDPPGNNFGWSCGNGNVGIAIDCKPGEPSSNSSSNHEK